MKDSGLGLQNIHTKEFDVNLTHTDFSGGTNSSVLVTAHLYCCQRHVTFLTADVLGNLARCSIFLPSLPEPVKISTTPYATYHPTTSGTSSPTVELTPTIATTEVPVCSADQKSLILAGMGKEFLRRAFAHVPGGAVIDIDQLWQNPNRRQRTGYSIFRQADKNDDDVLSEDEIRDYGVSLFERGYIPSLICGDWIASHCLGNGTQVSKEGWNNCLNIEEAIIKSPTPLF